MNLHAVFLFIIIIIIVIIIMKPFCVSESFLKHFLFFNFFNFQSSLFDFI